MTSTHTRNILKVYRRATPDQILSGTAWYGEAHALATEIAHGDTWRGAGVLAAFSPLTPWWRNVELAVTSFRTGVARTDTLGNSSRVAQRIIDGEEPLSILGVKTAAFCENIALNGFSDAVTVDVHAHGIANGVHVPSSRLEMGAVLYREIADSYRRAASRAGIMPTHMQAITWVVWRDMHPQPAARKGGH